MNGLEHVAATFTAVRRQGRAALDVGQGAAEAPVGEREVPGVNEKRFHRALHEGQKKGRPRGTPPL